MIPGLIFSNFFPSNSKILFFIIVINLTIYMLAYFNLKKYNLSEKNSLSVIIPCLNEEETLGHCLLKAKKSLKKYKIPGEIIVVDNGSQDNSIKIAKKFGARVVLENKNKGYGCALRKGIKVAKGDYILMADADNSYDFSIINKFYDKLINGYDFVQGCRFPIGGGVIKKNAMPITHKLFGNPFFSLLLKIFF